MNRWFSVVFVSMSLLLASGCSGGKTSSGKSGSVTIIYTGNVGAKINPCGCRPPLGGLARRAGALLQMKAEAPDAIVLDSGALLYDALIMNPSYEVARRARARLMNDEVGRSGIDVINLSPMDLAGSLDSLRAYGEGLPWCSVNIAVRATGKPVFSADVVKTAGELTVGVFGVTDDNSLGVPFFEETAPLTILDPIESARGEVEKLRKTCDLVVGLAYMDIDRARELARAVPGIDVIIASHTGFHNPSSNHEIFAPLMEGKTLIARCPDGGRVIGRLELDIVKGNTGFTNTDEVKDLRPAEVVAREKKAKTVSTYRNTFTDLSDAIPSAPGVQDRVDVVARLVDETDLDVRKSK